MEQDFQILASCVQDAADRAMIEATVVPHTTIDGQYLLVQDASMHPLALVVPLHPMQRPFSTAIRERAFAAANRAQAPLVIISTLRTVVAYAVSPQQRRMPLQKGLQGIWQGALVTSASELSASQRVVLTEALRQALVQSATSSIRWTQNVLDELQRCTGSSNAESIVQLLNISTIPVTIPPEPASLELVTDIVNAYIAESRRLGLSQLHPLPQFAVRDSLRMLYCELLREIASLNGLLNAETHEEAAMWLARQSGTPIPTIDAIDFALVAAGIHETSERTESVRSQPIRVVESGSSVGRLARRLHLLQPGALIEIVPQLGADASAMAEALENLSIGPNSSLILFVPLKVLRNTEYGMVRRTLAEKFHVEWVVLDDAEPFTEPDTSTCCIIAQSVHSATPQSVTTFACLRMPRSTIVPAAQSTAFPEDRIEALAQFVRYLRRGSRNRVNAEVNTRHVDRSTLLSLVLTHASAWDDLIIPADVISGILRKISPSLRPITDVATIANGLRTGANDVLIPTLAELDAENIEEQYWHTSFADGERSETTTICQTDDVESIAGLTVTERRLLLLPQERTDFAGTAADARISKAELEGVHLRPSLRNRTPWWMLDVPPPPTLIIPKSQAERWLVSLNPSKAYVTDIAVCITLSNQQHAEAIALWLNSTPGLFYHLLRRRDGHDADVTVRDARELLIPVDDILARIEAHRHRDFLYRPIQHLEAEYGTADADVVHPDRIRKDRRRLDRWLMEHIFGLTSEEQRWLYRLTLAWRTSSTNLRHLGTALALQITATKGIRRMSEWYDVRIEQLPTGTTRTIVIPPEITHVSYELGMFHWQLTLWKGAKADDAIECSSESEAELLSLLVQLGRRTVEIPSDALLVNEVLPLVRSFKSDVESAINDIKATLPEDVRDDVADFVMRGLM